MLCKVSATQFSDGRARKAAAPVAASGAALQPQQQLSGKKRPPPPDEGLPGGGGGAPSAAAPHPPCSHSIVAYTSASTGALVVEALLGVSGRKMGSNPKSPPERVSSMVCKRRLGELFAQVRLLALARAPGMREALQGEGAGEVAAPCSSPMGTYWQAKLGDALGGGHLSGSLAVRHRLAKRAWHEAKPSMQREADFSTWLHCNHTEWEGFSLDCPPQPL